MPKAPIILGLTGTNASGKGEIAEYLKKKGFDYFSLSDVIRDELKAKGKEPTRENLIAEGNRLRQDSGPSILAKEIAGRLRARNSVVDSIRNVSEVKELRKIPGFKLLSVDAPIEMRYERALSRGRAENAASLAEFRRMEERERSTDSSAQQIDRCMGSADIKVINDGTLEQLYGKIDSILKDLEGK